MLIGISLLFKIAFVKMVLKNMLVKKRGEMFVQEGGVNLFCPKKENVCVVLNWLIENVFHAD